MIERWLWKYQDKLLRDRKCFSQLYSFSTTSCPRFSFHSFSSPVFPLGLCNWNGRLHPTVAETLIRWRKTLGIHKAYKSPITSRVSSVSTHNNAVHQYSIHNDDMSQSYNNYVYTLNGRDISSLSNPEALLVRAQCTGIYHLITVAGSLSSLIISTSIYINMSCRLILPS